MADVTLDYGSAEVEPSANLAMQEEAMEDESRTTQTQEGSRFYALPTDQAVEAGAQRGPAPLTGAEEQSLDDATLVGVEEPSETPDPPAVESGSDIRLETLLIEGAPITQLSTSRLFAFLTHFGAQPLGLEWIDDQRCKIIFADERSARLALEYLCPTSTDSMQATDDEPAPLPNIDTLLEYEPDSWHSEYITSLVQPRKTHRIPAKLYTHIERQAALSELEARKRTQEAASSLPDDVPEIYREMEEEECKAKFETREVRDLKKLRSALWLRHAVTAVDRKESRAYTRSQWYKRHGFEAGKEIVPKLLQVGKVHNESRELFPDYKPSESQGKRARDDRRSMLDQLDSELDQHVAKRGDVVDEPERRQGEMMADAYQARQARHGDDGDLMDRLSSRGRRRHGGGDEARGSRSDGRWSHDGYDEFADDREGGGRRHGGRGRRSRGGERTPKAMDEELDDLRRSRTHQHQREFSPGRRPADSHSEHRHDGRRRHQDSGRVKVKGRGRMKAPGMASFDDRWDDQDAGSASLASRINKGNNDLLGRMTGGHSLADRFS